MHCFDTVAGALCNQLAKEIRWQITVVTVTAGTRITTILTTVKVSMSDSYRYDPDNPYSSHDRKDRDNKRRRERQNYHKSRTSRRDEFEAGVNSGNNPVQEEPYDDYGDYDYSKSSYAAA